MPYLPGKPVRRHTVNLFSGGEKRSRLMPCGTTRVVFGTKLAASGVVEITPSILLISQRGNHEWRCFAADGSTRLEEACERQGEGQGGEVTPHAPAIAEGFTPRRR